MLKWSGVKCCKEQNGINQLVLSWMWGEKRRDKWSERGREIGEEEEEEGESRQAGFQREEAEMCSVTHAIHGAFPFFFFSKT